MQMRRMVPPQILDTRSIAMACGQTYTTPAVILYTFVETCVSSSMRYPNSSQPFFTSQVFFPACVGHKGSDVTNSNGGWRECCLFIPCHYLVLCRPWQSAVCSGGRVLYPARRLVTVVFLLRTNIKVRAASSGNCSFLRPKLLVSLDLTLPTQNHPLVSASYHLCHHVQAHDSESFHEAAPAARLASKQLLSRIAFHILPC